MNLPLSTPDLPGIGGRIKFRNEDFFVQEIPAYEPGGEGEHVYAEVQKVGLTTFDLVNRLSDALRVPSRDIGFAGLKDARAVSRQVLSIPGVTEDKVMGLRLPNVQVMWAARHNNKLRLGHLVGNRFAIKVRDVEPTDVVKAERVVQKLQQRGMPNYFGEQRFGMRGNNHLLGAALIREDNKEVLRLLLGDPKPAVDRDQYVLRARTAFEARNNDEAMRYLPRKLGLERRILHRLIKTGKPGAAVRAIDEKLRRLWISALQSQMFNDVLAKRIDSYDKVFVGDWAYKHDNGAAFKVEDPAADQPRADAHEISPTGPLIGYRMSTPEGEPGAIESAVLEGYGLKAEQFRSSGKHRVKGARRPLRVFPTDMNFAGGVDEHGPHVTLA
ncbi:MAG TPA: tRNA pseudouridine(13) synthase TruD, partial [Tepidisphaeraceae bacterium]|nr:tRNA pseudouridine(13) synthase TruD [Tepidisphaeraceae bacterium]